MESSALVVKREYELELPSVVDGENSKQLLRFELGTATWGLQRTGQILWDGSTVLCNHITQCPGDFRDMRVVEIGCGCCALPAHSAANSGAKSVLATDLECEVPLLQSNVSSNAFARKIHVSPFDWSHESPLQLATLQDQETHIDVLICADIVYELTLEALVSFFDQLFTDFPDLIVYMSNTNRKHVQLFKRRLSKRFLFVENFTFSNSHPNVVLWKITCGRNR